MMSELPNGYEAERAQRIAENKAKMAQLGLLETSKSLRLEAQASAISRGTAAAPRLKPQHPFARAATVPSMPTRASKRLRGHSTPDSDGLPQENNNSQEGKPGKEAALGYTHKGSARRPLNLPDNAAYVAPFSLRSIGTTVWELGAVYRGAWAQQYWSSPGCLYHHAYPVGYRATKIQFGNTYKMSIEAGPLGPVFIVEDVETAATFKGSSPTRPWTEVCLSLKTGQRISGPLFFGFSDPVTQAAIARNCYSQRELEAAIAGETVEPDQLSPEEEAAKQFMTLDGVGVAVGMALALTTSLGGARHSGPESLAEWISQNHDERVVAVENFLLNSEEVPEATRRWPIWRKRFVPRVLTTLIDWRQNHNGLEALTGDASAIALADATNSARS